MRRINIIKNIAVKETLSIFRDKLSLVILLILPPVILVIFGYALRFDPEDVNFAVLDRDNTPESMEFIAHLDNSPTFRLHAYLEREAEILQSLTHGKQKVVVVIPKGFSLSLLNGEAAPDIFIDATDPMASGSIGYSLQQILHQQMDAHLEKHGIQSNRPSFNVSYLFNPDLRPEVIPIPGLIMIVFILISALMLSLSMHREKEKGTSRMLMLTPAGINEIIAGKVVPFLVICLVHITTIWLLSGWLFNIHVAGSDAMFFLMCLLFILNFIAYGLLISAFIRTELELLLACWFFLFVPNMFFSGFLFPISTMSPLIQPFAEIIPGTSFMETYRGVVLRGTSLTDHWAELINILLQTTVAYTLAIWGLKRNYLRKT